MQRLHEERHLFDIFKVSVYSFTYIFLTVMQLKEFNTNLKRWFCSFCSPNSVCGVQVWLGSMTSLLLNFCAWGNFNHRPFFVIDYWPKGLHIWHGALLGYGN